MFENNPFATHSLEISIILLGSFLLGLWFGWVLWGRLKEELDRLRLDNQSLNVTLDAIRPEIDSLKTRAVVAETDSSNLATQVVNLNRTTANLREKVTYLETELGNSQNRNRQVETELGLSLEPDAPVFDAIPLDIEEPVVDKKEVTLREKPSKTEMPTPPVLAIEPVAVEEARPLKPAKSKPIAPSSQPKPSTAAMTPDDLTVIEGIGPKIQMLLNQYGIYTYRHLAEADVARLKEILAEAGPQLAMHDPGTWPSQANLASNDQWDTLKSVQGFLKGGKKPE